MAEQILELRNANIYQGESLILQDVKHDGFNLARDLRLTGAVIGHREVFNHVGGVFDHRLVALLAFGQAKIGCNGSGRAHEGLRTR